jgi:hypothetical protein
MLVPAWGRYQVARLRLTAPRGRWGFEERRPEPDKKTILVPNPKSAPRKPPY